MMPQQMPQMPRLLTQNCLQAFLNSFDTVLTDCDGVLWSGDVTIGQANEAVKKLQSLGKKVFYVTNNSTKSRDEYVTKCERLGFVAEKEEIVSSSFVMAQYLKQQGFNKKVYVVGTSGMTSELDNVGIAHTDIGPEPLTTNAFKLPEIMKLDPEVGAVAVGFDPDFSFPKIMRAASYLENPECLFIATNTDERFPVSNSNLVFPGTGSFVRSVETVAERPPVIMGKPSDKMFTVISEKYQLKPSRTLMIGDRCNTDILFGKNCGLHTLVVLTGVTKKEDLESWTKSADEEKHRLLADYYLPQLGDLVDLLKTLE
ncbi:glycerol-3-phosphate phosphatase-like [Penaeus japonicus]|uniref:glycerol-3-phosphate phosphatase-like n=1 Tax=Penaeus japonicus TaxID=27405 RepID=UPI001C717885|nr:glycerol-3-phosphate phosphatase-like [Penaeus japonicus]